MAGRRPRVLVVEDDQDHRALIERALRNDGLECTVVGDGPSALERLSDVDLVLLDYRLPGQNGLEVLAEIRRRDDGTAAHPSVIMVTGMGSEELVATAMRAGAVDYVVKDPAYFSTLPGVIDRAWRHHSVRMRARHLQGLMLLVASATDRDEVFTEIVNGARELLDAASCALVLADGDLQLVASSGPSVVAGEVLEAAGRGAATDGPLVLPGILVVRLPTSAGDTVGVLTFRTDADRVHDTEELRLASTFAAVAGFALERLRRTELERSLVLELQRTIDQRQDFIASVSHELRTPLACILGFAETLETHWLTLAEPDRLDLLQRIGRHGAELKELVDQLLDVAARQKGRPATGRQIVDVRAVTNGVIEGLAPVLEGRPVLVELPDARVLVDPHLFGRVMTNLLSNAVKYSAPGAPIEVRGTVDSTHVRVSVTDHGVGLAVEEARRVFEPFWRGSHATATAARGTGIGLALVREYVTAMGGDVQVASQLGAGSTFSFTAPLAPAVEVASAR